jgi:hypothetical protein
MKPTQGCARPNELLDLVRVKISEEMNTQLCREFSGEEISNALFQMGPLKAPGPNGFPARFFPKTMGDP